MPNDIVSGSLGRWSFIDSNAETGSTTPFTLSERFTVVTDSVGRTDTYNQADGNRGDNGEVVEGTREALTEVSGDLVMEATPENLKFLLPHITGDAVSPYTLQPSLGFGFDYIRHDGIDVKAFRNCQINRFELSTRAGSPVLMRMNVVALVQEDNPFAFPAVTLGTDVRHAHYMAHDMVLTAGNPGAARRINDISVTIEKNLQPRQYNNLAIQCYLPQIRRISFRSNTPWGSAEQSQMYNSGPDGFAATLVLTRLNSSSTLTLTRLQIPANMPGVAGTGEIQHAIQGFVRGQGTTGELSWVNVSAL